MTELSQTAPANRFQPPEHLIGGPSLSLEQKRDLLKEWEADLRAQLVASEEGMTRPIAVTLSKVLAAKEVLAAKDKRPIATPPRPSDAQA